MGIRRGDQEAFVPLDFENIFKKCFDYSDNYNSPNTIFNMRNQLFR